MSDDEFQRPLSEREFFKEKLVGAPLMEERQRNSRDFNDGFEAGFDYFLSKFPEEVVKAALDAGGNLIPATLVIEMIRYQKKKLCECE